MMIRMGIGLLFLWNTTLVYAVEPAVLVQNKLSAIRTMSATFTQIIKAKHRIIAHSSGRMALSRPGRFFWKTERPSAQTIVADGQKVWMYDVDLEQVTVSQQSQTLGAASALFLSQSNQAVAHDFEVSYQKKGNLELFDLHAKSSKANFDHVRLTFQGEVLCDIALDDQLGQHTLVQFSHIITNQAQQNKVFHFSIPKGVDVVYQ